MAVGLQHVERSEDRRRAEHSGIWLAEELKARDELLVEHGDLAIEHERIGAQLRDRRRDLLTLKTAWADGTRHLIFEPLTLLEKLAALTPRPRINLVLYHGVLAPHAAWRARVVAYGAPPVEAPTAASASAEANDEPTAASLSRHWAWANPMRRAVDIDVLACPRCGGRLRLIATVENRGDSRDPRRPYNLARVGGSSSALRRVAGYQPRRNDQRLSAIRTPRTPRPVHSRLERSCLPRSISS